MARSISTSTPRCRTRVAGIRPRAQSTRAGCYAACAPHPRRRRERRATNKQSRGTMVSEARLKHFGWGREGEGASAEEESFAKSRAAQRFGSLPSEEIAPPRLEDIKLSAPRLSPPAALAAICSSEP